MAAQAALTVAGTLLSGEFRQLGLSSQVIPRRRSSPLSFLDGVLSLNCNCFWPIIPGTKDLKFINNSRSCALGKGDGDGFRSNVNEDTDEVFDDLLKRYGKVVYKNNDRMSQTADIDDDAECLAFAVAMAKVASEVKATDIKVLFVKPLVYWTRFFIIATAFSRPQIDALGSRIRDLAEKKYGKVPNGDVKPNSWTLLDFGDVVIHIFLPQQRTFYNLEEFYGNATPIELPFDDQSPTRI